MTPAANPPREGNCSGLRIPTFLLCDRFPGSF
jgi:hypothetical protein